MSRAIPTNHVTRARNLPRAKGRTTPKVVERMNKGERAYAAVLDQRKAAGHVAGYWFEFVSIRLADSTHYKPDFLVMLADGTLELHEVKGRKNGKDGKPDAFWAEEDSWIKIKISDDLGPFTVRVVWPDRNGGWAERVV